MDDREMGEIMKQYADLKRKVNTYKEMCPSSYNSVDDLSKFIFYEFVRFKMSPMEYIMLSTLMSLKSVEIYIKSELIKMDKKAD